MSKKQITFHMILIVMGVSGSGKSTVGKKLAAELGLRFYDADDFHSQSSIEKMKNGIPLTDQDRMPWLNMLARNIQGWEKAGGAVLACSALKERYRKILQTVPQIKWIYLNGSRETILKRLHERKSHYMSPALLDSQLAALEKPAYGIHVDISLPPDSIVRELIKKVNNMIPPSEIGLLGLGTMGKNLSLNLAENGVKISVYNRHVPGKEERIAENWIAENRNLSNLRGFNKLDEFIQSLNKPRRVFLMIYAGAIDTQIEELIPLLEPGDVIIDGGNSFYKDTIRRVNQLEKSGLHYVGAGISGGEEGARKGASIMAGGDYAGYEIAAKYLNLVAAKDKADNPCAAYIGPGGAGHFVKMVHNGIEYAEMQALSEVYSLLRYFLKITGDEIANIFSRWQQSELSSYLLGITVNILLTKEGDELLLDKILDQAGQKGTGGWSVGAALEYGVPYNSLSEAVMSRALSSMKKSRITASAVYQQPISGGSVNTEAFIASLKNAYHAARFINHDIGFHLMRQASTQNQWNLNLKEIARIWTNGCIIKSALMEELSKILSSDGSILLSPPVVKRMKTYQKDFSYVVSQGIQNGFALPVLSSALNYFLGYITADSPANLIQAQRDYFGAHTYERKDQPAGMYFHTNWSRLQE